MIRRNTSLRHLQDEEREKGNLNLFWGRKEKAILAIVATNFRTVQLPAVKIFRTNDSSNLRFYVPNLSSRAMISIKLHHDRQPVSLGIIFERKKRSEAKKRKQISFAVMLERKRLAAPRFHVRRPRAYEFRLIGWN